MSVPVGKLLSSLISGDAVCQLTGNSFLLSLKSKTMFLNLAHTKMEVFEESKRFVLECYRTTKTFPQEERFAMVQQIRRAALSVHLNIAEGCSRKSEVERKRFFEISRGSIIEIDTAFDIAHALEYVTPQELAQLGKHLISTFKQLTGLIGPRKPILP
jgi:four helix bundle protein